MDKEQSELKDQLLDMKKEVRIVKLRTQALINVLAKEGVVVKEDVDEEFDELMENA